jgi:signal transduction histidine kinase
MGGRVGVESGVGRGSRFWIELPEADRRLDEPAFSYPEHTFR